MKKLLKSTTNIPIPYAIVIGLVSTILIILTFQGEITVGAAIGAVIISGLFISQMYLGSIVLKTIIGLMVVIYSASIYTSAVMSLHGNIVEPFLLTIAAVTMFLAQTYSSKNVHFGLRSRVLWSSVLAFVLVSLKLAFILSNYSFLITEVIGLNILVIYIALWRLWMSKSKKTRIIYPEISKDEVFGGFKFIYIENQLDARTSKWVGDKYDKKNSNAFPYIYSEVLKAKESGLHVVFISEKLTNRIYDIEEIKLNKAVSIPYMYIEANKKDYFNDAMEGFSEEISRKKK